MTVSVLLEVHGKPGNAQMLKDTFKKILPDTRAYDGCQGVEVVANQDDPECILLIERWESRSHYEKYLGWREETGFVAELVDMLDQPPSIRYFDPVDA